MAKCFSHYPWWCFHVSTFLLWRTSMTFPQTFISVYSAVTYLLQILLSNLQISFCIWNWKEENLNFTTAWSLLCHCRTLEMRRWNSECCYKKITVSSKHPFLLEIASIWPYLECATHVCLAVYLFSIRDVGVYFSAWVEILLSSIWEMLCLLSNSLC